MTTMFATPIARTVNVFTIPDGLWQLFCSEAEGIRAFQEELANSPADTLQQDKERANKIMLLINEQAFSLTEEYYSVSDWSVAEVNGISQNAPFIYPATAEHRVEIGGELYELDGRLFGLVACLRAYQEASFKYFEDDPKLAEKASFFSYMLRKQYYEAVTEYAMSEQQQGASKAYIRDIMSLVSLFHSLLD